MDRKFGFRRIYRTLYAFYQGTIGRAEALLRHPIGYLEGIKIKMRINVQSRLHNKRDAVLEEKALHLRREINFTIDRMVERHVNKALYEYYEDRIATLETMLNSL